MFQDVHPSSTSSDVNMYPEISFWDVKNNDDDDGFDDPLRDDREDDIRDDIFSLSPRASRKRRPLSWRWGGEAIDFSIQDSPFMHNLSRGERD